VPVPGFEEKVLYVWFDACIGYISITAGYTSGWRQWWQSNKAENKKAKVDLYQFMGKDNGPFHTVIIPLTLLGTSVPASLLPEIEENREDSKSVSISQSLMAPLKEEEECPWTLLHHINTTEYLNYEEGKFSKSRAIGVFGNDARDSGIPVAYWRYYLLAMRPENTDSAFSWDDFGARINNELLANVGNLVSRLTKFAASRLGGRVPAVKYASLIDLDQTLLAKVNAELETYRTAMDGSHLKAGLKSAMAVGSLGNGYLTESGMDGRLLVEQPDRCYTVVSIGLNLIYLLSALLDPFLPTASSQICELLNAPSAAIPDGQFNADWLLEGHVLMPHPFLLFTRLEAGRLAELKAKFSGKQVL
jgi:methionyl-tRNA synthetase